MAFTIYGPGVADRVVLDNLFENRPVGELDPARAVRPIDENAEGGHAAPQQKQKKRKQAVKEYSEVHAPSQQQRQPAIRAEQIMSSPVTSLSPDIPMTEAWQMFRDTRYRHMPVVSANQEVVGILSDRTLLRYAATSGRKPPYDETSPEAKISIHNIFNERVITATPDTPIRHIAKMMFEKRVGAMPVVTEAGKLVGIITRSDILRTVVNQAPLELWV
jgi:acetoin utilization protein AcuB